MAASAIHLVAITSPAYAQVQPVPYGTSQPVPYNPAPAQSAPPRPAAPVTPGKDVIHLKNGGMLRGTIVDAIPGSHARIQLPTGEIAMVQWSEIARIETGDQKRAPEPTPTPSSPPPAPAPPPVTGPKVLVHIDSSRPVQLMRYDPVSGNRDEICTSPCDKWAPLDGNYRIEGSGVRQSSTFTLQGKEGDRVVIDTNPASRGWFTGGLVMGGISILGIITGAYVVAIGTAVTAIDNSTCFGTTTCSSTQKGSSGVEAVGWTIVGVSVVVGVIGVIAFASNWSTSVSQETQEPVARPAKVDVPRREAAWQGDDIARAMPKPLVTVPIYSGSF
jgi:hypothetical protein